jgi:signal transduction histidine kinase
VDQLSELLLQLLTQFAGGPGPAENNLVRFALPAVLWAILLYVAWSRQRHEDHPREKLLVWGFALGLLRELFMLGRVALKIASEAGHDSLCAFVEPIEHTLGLAATVVIAASFLRYILDDVQMSGRYLRVGLATAFAGCLITILWWPTDLAANPDVRFHESGSAVLLHLMSLILLAAAIVILVRQQGWLRNVVIVALSFLFLAEFLILLNYATSRAYVTVLCPIGNALHILAVVIFGFVYFREMSLDKKKAQQALSAYRDQLEDLVTIRTAELTEANKRLEKTAVLEERQRIAAEMHDGLAQTLSYLGIQTDRAGEMLQDGQVERVIGQFDHMRDAIGKATVDVRRSIASLQESPLPRRTLEENLAQLIDNYSSSAGPVVELQSQLPEHLSLAPDELDQVLKVVNEALLNVRQHAQASQVVVRATADGEWVKIVIADDGRGFDPGEQEEALDDHFGLSIMKARAARIGGQLTIHSTVGQGTEIALAWQPNNGRRPVRVDEETPASSYEAPALSAD